MSATTRGLVLDRIRKALSDVPADEAPDDRPIARDYLSAHASGGPADLVDLLAENLIDYRAHVRYCAADGIAETVGRLLSERGSRSVAVPVGLPAHWLEQAGDIDIHPDGPDLTAQRLDQVDSVLTGCTLAIAETGTLILGGPGQGRRILTLIPDHHICVVTTPDHVVASLPQALPLLDPGRPTTWISGPSATSDIELDRVEGVHGPRRLDVILVR